MATKKTTKYEKVNEQVKTAAASAQSVVIEQPQRMLVSLEITGVTPLIQNCFNQKVLEDMLRKHMGFNVTREKKIPRQCIERAKILNTKGIICMPVTAFKKSMLTARALVKGLSKTQLQTQVYIVGNSVPIQYREMVNRMDMVRTSGMGHMPDIRFRPEFRDWKARLVIQFPDNLKVQSLVDLLNRAGDVGIGEWRPERNGIFGRYAVTRHISDRKEIAEVMSECEPLVTPLVIPEWALDCEIDEKVLRKVAYSEEHGADDEDEADPSNANGEHEVPTDELDREVD
jgi:hypothetical protein